MASFSTACLAFRTGTIVALRLYEWVACCGTVATVLAIGCPPAVVSLNIVLVILSLLAAGRALPRCVPALNTAKTRTPSTTTPKTIIRLGDLGGER
jgi:hypothetical protein